MEGAKECVFLEVDGEFRGGPEPMQLSNIKATKAEPDYQADHVKPLQHPFALSN